jgi:hypothetical protein
VAPRFMRHAQTGRVGRLVEEREQTVVVELDGLRREWSRRAAIAIPAEIAPRGLVTIDERMRASARLHREGATTRELAALHCVSVRTVQGWLRLVAAADADARRLEQIRSRP